MKKRAETIKLYVTSSELKKLHRAQEGMASLVVTTVLISVIGLLVIGYSAMVRRNQQETLDRQLSTQAYYAAESGVEYASAKVSQTLASGGSVSEKASCAESGVYTGYRSLDGGNATVSCLLVDNSLPSMYYETITSSSNTVVPIIPENPATTISSIDVEWRPSGATDPSRADHCGTGLPFPEAHTTPDHYRLCKMGVLTATIVPGGAIGSGNTPTVYLKPDNFVAAAASTITSPVSSSTNKINWRAHTTADKAVARINVPAANTYYLKLNSIYGDVSVTIIAHDAGGNVIQTKGQVLIDSTAKATGVEKRIQVRVPALAVQTMTPVAALQSGGSTCKRFTVAPGLVDPASYCAP